MIPLLTILLSFCSFQTFFKEFGEPSKSLLKSYSICNISSGFDNKIADKDSGCLKKTDTLTKLRYSPKPEKPAENIGGANALTRSFQKNILLDSLAEIPVNPSRIAWIVKSDGMITGERILNGTDSVIGLQMIAIVKSFKWTPGECNGKKVNSLLWQSIIFEFDR